MAVADPRWLQVDDQGDDVRALQQAINVWMLYEGSVGVRTCDGLRFPAFLEEDGIFGPRTRDAVVWIQCRFLLDQDGLAGPQTLGGLAKFLASQGLGELGFGTDAGVLPVQYTATAAANQLRSQAGLPALPLPAEGAPAPAPSPTPWTRWLPWAVLGAGILAFVRRRRR